MGTVVWEGVLSLQKLLLNPHSPFAKERVALTEFR